MKYISKGLVVAGSTEDILHITRCGIDFQLTGEQADLWINGRFGFSCLKNDNPIVLKALKQLQRQELVEVEEDIEVGEYRALTRCILVPAKTGVVKATLSSTERDLMQWLREAGLRLTMAELVFLVEHDIRLMKDLLGPENRQRLTEVIYTQENIFDNILEIQMEHAKSRDVVVKNILQLLKKKRILLL